jgi:hypothetical protein
MRGISRSALVLAAGAALAFATTGQAVASPVGGFAPGAVAKHGPPMFDISFSFKTKNGKPVKVTKFNYGTDCSVNPPNCGNDGNDANNVPMSCDQGDGSTFLSGYLAPMKVKQKEFGGKFKLNTDSHPNDKPEASVTVHGKFVNHNQAVDGDLRVQGDFGEGMSHATNCDSTKLLWSAS